MRRLLPALLCVACNTPGTFGSAIFGTNEDDGPNEQEMIAQLEAEPVAGAPPARVLAKIPTLPSSTWIQVFDRSARIAHRIHDDGRYTVQFGDGEAQEMPIISRSSPETRLLAADARERIEQSLAAVRFPSVAPHIPKVELTTDESLKVLRRRPLALTIRDATTGGVHTVEVEADPGVTATFGPLAPLWRTLDQEVFGRWLHDAVAGNTAPAAAP